MAQFQIDEAVRRAQTLARTNRPEKFVKSTFLDIAYERVGELRQTHRPSKTLI